MKATSPSREWTDTKRVAFRADVQGLRALAVLLVLAYHAGLSTFSGGYIGVDVFFVISGYLITNHLVSQIAQNGTINFAEFYAKRIRRILPASFAVLIATGLACVIFLPPVLAELNLWDGVWTAVYVPNIAFAIDGTNYFAEQSPSAFRHYWSLGVEEQFYLIWPIVLVAMSRLVRGRRNALVAIVAALVALSMIAAVLLTFEAPAWAFFSLPTRAWELGAGAIIALIGTGAVKRIAPSIRAALSWLAIASIVIASVGYSDQTAFPGYAAIVPVLATAVIIYLGQIPAKYDPGTMLSIRPAQFFGRISYTLYLVHWPMLVIPGLAAGAPLDLATSLILAAAAVPVAWLVTVCIEDPARTGKLLTGASARTMLVGLIVASVTTVTGFSVAIASAQNAPLHSGRPADLPSPSSSVPEAGEPPLDFTTFVPSNLTPSLREYAADRSRLADDGCHLDVPADHVQHCSYGDIEASKTIALFGDSHAEQWFPAIEAIGIDHGYRIDSYTKSSCPAVDHPIYVRGIRYTQCETWRNAVIENLVQDPPAVIVLANMTDQPNQPGNGIDPQAWADGLKRVIESLPDVPIVVIADTPNVGRTPAICLSSHIEDALACSVDRVIAIDQVWREKESGAALEAGAIVVDMNDKLCTASECGMIVGSTLVYRDAHHLTATMAKQLAPYLWERLKPIVQSTVH